MTSGCRTYALFIYGADSQSLRANPPLAAVIGAGSKTEGLLRLKNENELLFNLTGSKVCSKVLQAKLDCRKRAEADKRVFGSINNIKRAVENTFPCPKVKSHAESVSWLFPHSEENLNEGECYLTKGMNGTFKVGSFSSIRTHRQVFISLAVFLC